jgi:hypothetical protein
MRPPVSKEDDYRKHAGELVDLARRSDCNGDKRRLLAMAEAWLDLADRARRLVDRQKHPLNQHPLIRSKLWGDQVEG